MIFNLPAYLSDQMNLLSKIGFGRLFNLILIVVSFRLSSLFRKAWVWGYPFSISLETAAVCNLKCPECITGTSRSSRKNTFLKLGLINQKLHLHRKTSFYCNLYFQGEPFLNPELESAIKLAKKNNYYTVVSTNGHFLNQEKCVSLINSKLDRIIISLDGINPQSYQKYRTGGVFEKVVEGIKRLSDLKKQLKSRYPLIVVQFLVNRDNEDQLKDAEGYIKSIGADVLQFKSMQIYSEKGMKELLPLGKKYNRYAKPKKVNLRSTGIKCFRLWSHMVYTSDGMMVPCCFDKIPEYGMGKNEIKKGDLWKSPEMQKFRNAVLKNSDSVSVCSNCIMKNS